MNDFRASAGSSTTLRPRNRRRTNEDDENAPYSSLTLPNDLEGPSISSTSSRAASPLPNAHPSRPGRSLGDPQRSRSTSRFLGVPGVLGSQVTPSALATGLWESSWSSLQGIASNLLGSDSSRASSPAPPVQRKRRPIEATRGRYTSTQPAQWGPQGSRDKQPGAGTGEDRRLKLQVKKREALLAANGHVAHGASGRYKRRDSNDRTTDFVPSSENKDTDALVYLHRVKTEDTLAGIMIKYNCDSNVFRKANRLWPNDSIQVRKTVVLPVDACGAKGRRITEPDETAGSLGSGSNGEIMPTSTTSLAPWADSNSATKDKETPFSSMPTSPSISVTLSNPEESPWKHDSWVRIDGFSEAVEIARLSRRTLGYFPRSRRKSQTFSDLETPPASFDLPTGSFRSTPPPERGTKSRSSSGSFLHGPGGVGTMGRNVRSPGPAQDGLNKLFAKHLPDVAPRSSFESIESSSSRGNGIENLGGAVEGWVRKLASKAAKSVQPQAIEGPSGVGDLIELSEDAFEVGEGDDEGLRNGKGDLVTDAKAGRWSTELEERTLHERFPPRGKSKTEPPRREGER